MYKKFEWKNLKTEFLNRYFWKMIEEIKSNPELNKDFTELTKHPNKLKNFINSNQFEWYKDEIIGIDL